MILNKITLTIEKVPHNGNIIIRNGDEKRIYVGYGLRDAIAIHRNLHSLQGKHLNIIKL